MVHLAGVFTFLVSIVDYKLPQLSMG